VAPTVKNPKVIKVGIYEQWIAKLNNCVSSASFLNQGMHFDSRNAATAKRTLRGKGESMQPLSGTSQDRFIFLPRDTWVGAKYCTFFDKQRLEKHMRSNGVFYTDPYFRNLESGSGRFVVRQYIRPNLPRVVVPKGKSIPVDSWYGHYEKNDKDVGIKFMNPEHSIKATEN